MFKIGGRGAASDKERKQKVSKTTLGKSQQTIEVDPSNMKYKRQWDKNKKLLEGKYKSMEDYIKEMKELDIKKLSLKRSTTAKKQNFKTYGWKVSGGGSLTERDADLLKDISRYTSTKIKSLSRSLQVKVGSGGIKLHGNESSAKSALSSLSKSLPSKDYKALDSLGRKVGYKNVMDVYSSFNTIGSMTGNTGNAFTTMNTIKFFRYKKKQY